MYDKIAKKNNEGYLLLQENSDGLWDYSLLDNSFSLLDGGVFSEGNTIDEAMDELMDQFPEFVDSETVDYDTVMEEAAG